jgi:hypothetical protein
VDVDGAEHVHQGVIAGEHHHLGLATDADLAQAFGVGGVELDEVG